MTDTTFEGLLTHSRAGNATMTDSDGLLKWAPHNLAVYSEDFSNAAWIKSNAIVTSNDAIAPDGTLTADKITFSGTGGNQSILGFNTLTGRFTNAFFIKAADASQIGLTVRFDTTGGGAVGATKTLTNDWQLVTAINDPTGYYQFRLISTTGMTATSFHLWGGHTYQSDLGGMVNNPDTGDSYVPTTSDAVYKSRVGHHVWGGAAWVNEGLLLESAASTNLTLQSEKITGWTNAGGTFTNTGSTRGGFNDWMRYTSSGVGGATRAYSAAYAVVSGTPYTFKVFIDSTTDTIDAGAGVWELYFGRSGADRIQIRINTSTWTITSVTVSGTLAPSATSGIRDVGNGIYMLWVTLTPIVSENWTSGIWEPGVGVTGYIDVTGWTFEAATVPTSYIPTSTATVTRAAETLTIAAANMSYSATAMSFAIEGKMNYADDATYNTVAYRWYLNATNRIQSEFESISGTGRWATVQQDAGGSKAVQTGASAYSPGLNIPMKWATRNTNAAINGAYNGTLLTANTTPISLPNLSATTFQLGSTFNGTIRSFRQWDVDITDVGITEAST